MHTKELTVFVGEVDGEESGVIRLRIISIGEIIETGLECCSGVPAGLSKKFNNAIPWSLYYRVEAQLPERNSREPKQKSEVQNRLPWV